MGLKPSELPFNLEEIQAMFLPALTSSIYGVAWVTNAFLPLIEQGGQKKIVCISSGMSEMDIIKRAGTVFAVPYGAGKASMNNLVAKYHVELAPKGIKTLAMSPGWVDTYEGPCTWKVPQFTALQSLLTRKRLKCRLCSSEAASGSSTGAVRARHVQEARAHRQGEVDSGGKRQVPTRSDREARRGDEWPVR